MGLTEKEHYDLIESAMGRTLAVGRWDEVKSTVAAKGFELLLDLALPTLEHFRSDLYHDAVHLHQRWETFAHPPTGSPEFFYAVSDSGTALTNDRAAAEQRAGAHGHVYICELRVRRSGPWPDGVWSLLVSLDTEWRNLSGPQEVSS